MSFWWLLLPPGTSLPESSEPGLPALRPETLEGHQNFVDLLAPHEFSCISAMVRQGRGLEGCPVVAKQTQHAATPVGASAACRVRLQARSLVSSVMQGQPDAAPLE